MIHPERTTVSLLLLATVLAARSVAQEAVLPPLRESLPALADQSSWAQDARADDPDARRGAYPVGNGRVFAWCGTGTMANELRGVSGPHFHSAAPEVDDGHFGAVVVELVDADDEPLALPRQRVRRVRGAAFVVTEDASDAVALRTLTFAPPDTSSIVRVIEVANLGATELSGLALRIPVPSGTAEGDAVVARHGANDAAVVAAFALEGGRADGVILRREIPSLEPGASSFAVLEIATASGREATVPAPSLENARERAEATLGHWRARLEGTLVVETDHAKLRDLVQDWKVLLLQLRDERSGVFVPAQHRRVASVMENNGAVVAALRLGLWQEARSVLEYWWNATRLLGEVPDEVPLDLDFGAIDDEHTAKTEFWERVRVPAGGAASWILLQHLWYWRTTADSELIERHWPMLEVCLKRQRRGPDDLLLFSGREPWLRLARSLGEDAADPALFVAEAPGIGRRSWSFENSVLFLLAVQAFGELVDGLDETRNPARWADGPPEDRPSAPYARRSFDVLKNVEKRFWLDDPGYFAPALSPVADGPHREPVAEANLLPLWVGWTFPTGEKSRDNLRNSLARLWRDGARIGSTATVGHATGDLQGRLLMALSERDGKRRLDVLDSLLELAEPAGEWPSFVDPRGRAFGLADRSEPERLSPGVGGTNLDAILFAITGIRHLAVPNWDDDDIRLELRLPEGASFVTIRGSEKDERELNIFFRRERSMLTEEEMQKNDELAPEKRRDPAVPHDRLRFVVELVKGKPTKGYYDVGLNAEGTMFVRYLQPDAPSAPDAPDLRRIEEMEFSRPDTESFLPEGERSPITDVVRRVDRAENPRLLVLTCRPLTADTMAGDGVTVFDTGLPFDLEDLRGELLSPEGAPVHDRLYVDWGADAPPPATWTSTGFWRSRGWQDTLAAYRAAGGEVLEPQFVRLVEWSGPDMPWRAAEVAEDGLVQLPAEATEARFAIHVPAARDAVLRTGSTFPFVVQTPTEQRLRIQGGADVAVPDEEALLLRLVEGTNAFRLQLEGDTAARALYLRLTDASGLPIEARY